MGKMRIQLMNALVDSGLNVDLVLGKAEGSHTIPLDRRIQVYRIGTTHTIFAVPTLTLYLKRHRPGALLTQRVRENVLAHRARRVAQASTRIFATRNTHASSALGQHPPKKRDRRLRRIRQYYGQNDGVIAISHGVAEDFAQLMGWSVERIAVAPNPVLTNDIDAQARAPVDHPWFQPGQPPVVLGIGRLQEQKDFFTLIRAFARLRQHKQARLVILGEGHLRDQLNECARMEGIEQDFDMPGFVDNVYAYLARSRVFALSSAWEGFGNVVAEAMAVGTPVVATDCPSGPAEILEGGRLGPLVPVGDPSQLAAGLERVWDDPPDPAQLRSNAMTRFSANGSASTYRSAMGL